MQYKINKIDDYLQRKLNDERSNEKIHDKKEIFINKDKTRQSNKDGEKHLLEKTYEVEAVREDQNASVEIELGHNIDIRR